MAKDFAAGLVNKALGLEGLGRWPEALGCYDDAIYRYEECLRTGMTHLLPDLLRTIRYRLMTVLDLQEWDQAAHDVERFLTHLLTSGQMHMLSAAAGQEVEAVLDRLRELEREQREQLYAALDE